MSTPSKKRRKAREWMQERLDQEAKREHEHAAHAANLKRIHDERLREERERWTSVFPNTENRDVWEPLGRPEHRDYVATAMHEPGAHIERFLNRRDLRYYDRPRQYRFRVKQFAQVMPCGLKVVWYGLEQCG